MSQNFVNYIIGPCLIFCDNRRIRLKNAVWRRGEAKKKNGLKTDIVRGVGDTDGSVVFAKV